VKYFTENTIPNIREYWKNSHYVFCQAARLWGDMFMRTEILRMECISKTFPGVKVLNNVNINVFKGEVLALIGANGAGKSSLMKILAGIYTKDNGRIFFDEKEVEIKSPRDAQRLGISVIHQGLNLIPNLSVAENIFLGNEKRHELFFIDKKQVYKSATKLLDRVELKVDANVLVDCLSIAQRQLVGIARVLATNPSLIIMDEPTSSLTERETGILRKIIFKLKEEGVSIIFISHKLKEALEVADRITVLRDGVSMGTYSKMECNEEMLISLMVGSDFEEKTPECTGIIGEEILRVENISTKNLLKDVSFVLRKGEILGFAGLLGSGRTELMNVIFGIAPKSSGVISIKGNRKEIQKPLDAIKNKMGLVPEDRNLQGLILNMSIKENISLPSRQRVSYRGIINFRMESFLARYYMQKLMVKAVDEDEEVGNLSGGNQQKVVVSKWLAIKPEILILDEPTKGIDVGVKKEIHQTIRKLAKEGTGIILVSSELEEILAMSDRILVMHDGMIKGEFERKSATQEKILSAAFK